MTARTLFSMVSRGHVKNLLQWRDSFADIRNGYAVSLPPAPTKTPKSAYLLFAKGIRPQLLKDNPGISAKEMVEKTAIQWRGLDSISKRNYLEQWKNDSSLYQQMYSAYVDSLTSEQKALLEDEKNSETEKKRQKRLQAKYDALMILKRPVGAYALFVKDKMALRGSASVQDYMKVVAEKWKTADEVERKKYVELVEVERQKYVDELEKFEKRLETKGKKLNLGKEQLRAKYNELLMPKKPVGGYTLFVKDQMVLRGSASIQDYMKTVAEKWKTADEAERKKYVELAEVERQKYVEELEKFEKRLDATKKELSKA